MAKPGRKTSLTPEKAAFIVDAIRQGVTDLVACQAGGINPKTFYTWLKRGETSTKKDDEPYRQFYHDVKLAKAFCEATLVNVVRRSVNPQWLCVRCQYQYKEWQPVCSNCDFAPENGFAIVRNEPNVADAKWMLERKYPKRWGMRQQIKHSGGRSDDGPVEFVLRTPTPNLESELTEPETPKNDDAQDHAGE